MAIKKFHSPVVGFSTGLNTQASALNILPTELMLGSVNLDILKNGAARRRRGVDFIGESDAGGFLQQVRQFVQSAESAEECPSAIYVRLSAPNGSIIERIVLDINNEFWVYEVTNAALSNVDTPKQTLARNRTFDLQKFKHMSFAQSGDKLFFAGEHSQPGYLKVNADNVNLDLIYFDVDIRDPSSLSDVIHRYAAEGAPTETSSYPKSIDFFAGRVWLSGDPKFPNTVYFSQVIVSELNITKYYQAADPNSSTDPDLVDNDGGVILVQGAGLINQVQSVKNSMFIGATTGTWQILGTNGVFKATDFGVHKVLSDGVDGPACIVPVETEVMLFGQTAIWLSQTDTSAVSTTVGEAKFKNLSKDRIEDLYTGIPVRCKASGNAVYNRSDRKVYFFVNLARTNYDKSYNPYNQPGYARNVLVIDTNFTEDVLEQDQVESQLNRKAKNTMMLWELDDGANDALPYVTCPFISKSIVSRNDPVISNDEVVVVGADSVVVSGNEEAKLHLLCVALQRIHDAGEITMNAAFATFNTSVLKDWASDANFDINYDSRAVAGINSFGNITVKKATMYIYFVFKRIESGVLDGSNMDLTPGACQIAVAWDFATSTAHPKMTDFTDAYFPYRYGISLAGAGENAYDHVYFKKRIRGRGRHMRVEFQSVLDKDFYIVGWSTEFTTSEFVQ